MACACLIAHRPQLLDEQTRVRDEKKKLRKILRDFEDDFYQLNGRKVQKEDRAPMNLEYQEYKVRNHLCAGRTSVHTYTYTRRLTSLYYI